MGASQRFSRSRDHSIGRFRRRAPTHFGDLTYDVVSDAEHGSSPATVDIPARHPARSVVLRLRHPQAKHIKSVTVNGKPWGRFDAGKETVTLIGQNGTVRVVASY